MTRVRLLLVVTQSEFGGAQKYVHSLATRLPTAEYDILVVCGPGGPLVPRLRATGVAVTALDPLVRELDPARDWRAFRQLRAIIRSWRPHIVHANSSKAGLLARLAAKMCGTPAILYTAHGFVLSEPLGRLTRAIYWCAEKVGAVVGDYTIAVSEWDRRLALRYRLTTPGKIVTIHNGIEPLPPDGVTPAPLREDLGLSAGEPLIGSVANFYPTKGLTHLVRASALVHREVPDARVVLVGDGEEGSALRGLVRDLGLEEVVRFLGRRDDVDRILAGLDLFVLSSVKEGLPFALLEAMRLARPIVATRVGGVPEALRDGDAGIVVEPGDERAMASAIIRLLRDPAEARRLGCAAGRRVAEEFSREQMLTSTAALYRQALAEAGRRA